MAKKKFWIGSVGPLIYDDVNTYGDAVTHKGFRTEGIVQVDGAPASPSHVVRLTDLNSAVATLAPKDATYVTISANTVLTDERTLAVGDSLTKTDGGAGSTVTLDAVQDIRTTASPKFENLNLGVSSRTAALHIKAGTATAGTAPIKLDPGTLLTAVEQGTLEYKGHTLYFTTYLVRRSVVLAQEIPVADVTVVNDATETTIYSISITADYLTVGKQIVNILMGIFSSVAGANGVLTFKLKYAGATVATIATTTGTNTNSPWQMRIHTTCRAIGSGTSGKLISFVEFKEGAATLANVMVAGALTNIDTTTGNTLTITATWATADNGNTVTVQQANTLCVDANN